MIQQLKNEISILNSQFDRNLDSVRELANFDSLILQFATGTLSTLETQLTGQAAMVLVQKVINAKTALESINSSGSLSVHYRSMYNQCLVLLVSYFSSDIKELLSTFLKFAIELDTFENIKKTELKLTVSEFQKMSATDKSLMIGLLFSSQNASFQDMKSISKVTKYFLPRYKD
jgi:hypothetical protein